MLNQKSPSLKLTPTKKALTPEQISMIEEALASTGEYGEVRLIIEKGQIRFVTVSRSFDALKWQNGSSTGAA